MTLNGIRPGDLVKVKHKDRIAFAEVTGKEGRTLNIRPLSRDFTWRSVTAREVVGIWKATTATRQGAGW